MTLCRRCTRFGSSNVQLRNANGLSIPARRKVMVSYDVLLHAAQSPLVQSDFKRPLLSVGKLTQSGAEVKFGDKNSWIDLQTGTGVQRVLVRVKGKTFGLSIQNTDAWIIPETSDPAPHAVVAMSIKRSTEKNNPSFLLRHRSCSGTTAGRDSRHAARARST